MDTIENTQFQKLLDDATIEPFCGHEYILYNEEADDFYFYFDIDTNEFGNVGMELSEGQKDKVYQAVMDFYKDNQPEQSEGFFGLPDYHSEYGTNEAMFI